MDTPFVDTPFGSAREFQNCTTPNTLSTVSFFLEGPVHGTAKLVMKFLTVLGGSLVGVWNGWGMELQFFGH